MIRRLRERLLSLRSSGRRVSPRPVILMYHRVACVTPDPWALAVTPARFEEQLRWLAGARTVMSMYELMERLAVATLPDDAAAITFDDGYLDNLSEALPILDRLRLPATLFAVSGAIGRNESFWWDELAKLILLAPAADMSIQIAGKSLALRWSEDDRAHPGWRADSVPPGPRERAYLATWQLLQRASLKERVAFLDRLRCALLGRPDPADRAMTWAELAGLLDNSVFSLGGHSITHPALTSLDAEACAEEVTGSLAFCRRVGSIGPTGFAYPYGDLNESVRNLVAQSGFAWACSTRRGTIGADADRYSLPRLAVENCSADELARQVADLPEY